MNHSSINQWIKWIRQENRLNQIEFSKKLGIQQTYVSKLENGRETISLTLIEKICKLFDEDFDEAKSLLAKTKEGAVAQSLTSHANNEMEQRVQKLEQKLEELNETLMQQVKVNAQLTEANLKLTNKITMQDSPSNESKNELENLRKSDERMENSLQEVNRKLEILFRMFQDEQKKDSNKSGTNK